MMGGLTSITWTRSEKEQKDLLRQKILNTLPLVSEEKGKKRKIIATWTDNLTVLTMVRTEK